MTGLSLESNLIDELLAEQQRLTPVERFAKRHQRADFPAQARYYRDLIPSSRPAGRQQYAFAVDLDACSGCKACVSACHSLNGLEENETWRDVGLITGSEAGKPYLQTVTTACHHCLEPACLEGCPVLAYDKDPETGIVRHLDDQCIGCQYCTMKCPYDVPKYSHRLGIVRKCDMCTDRLAVGEAPACVQACPHEAITIRLVDADEINAATSAGRQIVPGAFDSSYTKPTTKYLSERGMPKNAEPADAHVLRLEHPHWPLIIMLLFSQLAVGMFVTVAVMATVSVNASSSPFAPLAATIGFVALNVGLGASVFHLGRPLGAWRFFLGLRTSWMSREILAFAIFAAVASLATVLCWIAPASAYAQAGLKSAALVGLAAVFTSVMIYADTRRAWWTLPSTAARFYGATIVLGVTAVATVLSTIAASEAAFRVAMALSIGARAMFFIWESLRSARAAADAFSPIHHSEKTIRTLLPWFGRVRLSIVVLGILVSVVALSASAPVATVAAGLALALSLLGHLLERFGFFAAVTAPRMPGGV
jgi:formate dehydrogenase iron-sulfur subunit